MSKRKTSPGVAEAVAVPVAAAADSQTTANKILAKIVVCAFPGTEGKMKKLWEQAIGDFPMKVISSSDVLSDLAAAVIDTDVDEDFVLVPANTFPSKKIRPEELLLPVVYVGHDGRRTYSHSLPMQFCKASLVDLLSDNLDEEDLLKKASELRTPVPLEVAYSFGNFVTPVRRGTPCESKVIEAMIHKKYIATNQVGWKAIEHLIDNLIKE